LLWGLLAGGCVHSHDHGTHGLALFEIDFLTEDVIDLVAIGFQAAENAYVGDPVQPVDVIETPDAANSFTVTYDLPPAFRVGLGDGSGSVALQIFEDGVVNPDPLGFDIQTTTALTVEIYYDLDYLGTAVSGRATDVLFGVTAVATRADPADPFLVEYLITGDCFLGQTYCDWDALFRAFGRPRDGIVEGFGGADGVVDDPDVLDFYEFHKDWRVDHFRTRGSVGFDAFLEELVPYDFVIF
jgi:hypothetical protein